MQIKPVAQIVRLINNVTVINLFCFLKIKLKIILYSSATIFSCRLFHLSVYYNFVIGFNIYYIDISSSSNAIMRITVIIRYAHSS